MYRLVCVLVTVLTVLIPSRADNGLMQTGTRTWYIDEELVLEVEREDYTQVNRYIAQYLIGFTNFQEESNDQNVKDAMDIIKLLIVQSWIKMFNPDRELVESFVPMNEMQSLEVVRNNIVRALRASNAKYPVADAIIFFSDEIEPQIDAIISKETKALEETLDKKLLEIAHEVDDKKKEELLHKYQLEEEKLDGSEFDYEFHSIAKEMYLQSFVNDFLVAISEDKLIIRASNGRDQKVFQVPGFDVESLGSFH